MLHNSRPSRRDFLTLAAGAFAVAAVPFAAHRRARLHASSLPVMGTMADIAVVHSNERYAFAAMKAAHAELQRVERLMSRFDARSDIGRANARAGQRVSVSRETSDVLQSAIAWASATNGGFDPALARVVDLWDVKHSQTPPPAHSVARLAGRKLYRHIDLDENSVKIGTPEALIDLGGIACGHGVDCAVNVLREWGITDGYLNVGGDIYALGHAPDGDQWKIGVRSPRSAEEMLTTIHLSDAAIATSGDYEQGYTYRGRRYHHIIDPASAEPRITNIHSITVVADKCIDADAASTAVFGLSASAAQRVLSLRAPTSRIVSAG